MFKTVFAHSSNSPSGQRHQHRHQFVEAVIFEGRSNDRSQRGQQGSVLLFVLGILILLTFGVVAVLNMSVGAVKVASNMESSTRTIQKIDGSMEYAANLVRNDVAICAGADQQIVFANNNNGDYTSPYDVYCSQSTGGLATDDLAHFRRTMDLYATDPDASNTVVARSRVRVTDRIGNVDRIGYTIEVCDWILSAQAVAAADPSNADPEHGVRGCSP